MKLDNLVVLDCEVYPNYVLFAFKSLENQKVLTISLKGETDSLSEEQAHKLRLIMASRTTFGFNSNNYDLLIIAYALQKMKVHQIFELSKIIIESELRSWQIANRLGINIDQFKNHFDIMEVAPAVRISLKLYGGRLHCKTLQDLPYDPLTPLTDEQIIEVEKYCVNDLNTTIALFEAIKDRVKLRSDMSLLYSQDLMSKSDAQIAEKVIKSKINYSSDSKNKITRFQYKAPGYIKFQDQQLAEVLSEIENTDFVVDDKGSVKMPQNLSNKKINIGRATYKLGIGGIHSMESCQTIIPAENELLIDKDVASYYPSIIINLGLYPKALGANFLNVYKSIVDERLKAKKEGNKVLNESLKILINGSFGKFGSIYSALYSPDLMITVTMTGQLSLLMLIERLENLGVRVVSSNTDGFVSLINKNLLDEYENICQQWQNDTGFVLESKRYDMLLSRDVNNYLAVTDNEHKGKGVFALDSLSKNPSGQICYKAIINLLTTNTPIEDTIRSCSDVKDFIYVRSVTGGGVHRNNYLGKVVRWYYSTDGDVITYKKNGNKVPDSHGSKPLMILPDELPADIDYQRYISDTYEMLESTGFFNCL